MSLSHAILIPQRPIEEILPGVRVFVDIELIGAHRPISGTPFSDVFRGIHQGSNVLLKRRRTYNRNSQFEEFEVSERITIFDQGTYANLRNRL
jgi:hypothetical protein